MSGYALSQDLMAAAIADRGNVHPWDAIPVARTALVVIDMQNYFVAPNAQGEAETARDIVPAINRLAAALRERGGRVIWIQNTTTDTREKWSVRPAGKSRDPPGRNGTGRRRIPALADARCPRR